MKDSISAALALLIALAGCSGGSGNEGDAGTETPADTPADTTADVPPDAPADPDAAEDTSPDAATDTGTDTAVDTTTDTAADTAVDTAADTAVDTGTDASTDTATDPSCDPCYVGGSYVSGCTAMCGGFAGTPCPDTTVLTCVYATGSDAGICIPTVNLGCSVDADCACFPHFSICTTTRWTCASGSCSVACI
jgi:hypothetical protein